MLRMTLTTGALALVGLLPVDQGPDLSADDRAVYTAVLEGRIRPEVARSSAGISSPIVLVFDRTLAICRPERPSPLKLGCLSDREVQVFEGTSERRARPIFNDLANPAIRGSLAKSFRLRNDDNHPFPHLDLPWLVPIAPEQLDESLKREARRTTGFASFSQPAYADDGHALVYASYVCGGLCGYGWFFLLSRDGAVWRVLSAEMLWIS